MKNYRLFLLLIILLVVAFMTDIAIGSVNLSIRDVWDTLTGGSDNLIYREIIINHRLPKALTAILAGASLSVAGVLMQTLFHNPLAGPDVLGVTSGASLGVALLPLGTSSLPLWLIAGWGQVTAAIIGAIGVLLLVIIVSIKIPQTVSLLIIGMMFGNFAGAIVSILPGKAEQSGYSQAFYYLDLWQPLFSGLGTDECDGPRHCLWNSDCIALAKTTQYLVVGKKLCQRIGSLCDQITPLDYSGHCTFGRNFDSFYRSYSLHRHHHAPCSQRIVWEP